MSGDLNSAKPIAVFISYAHEDKVLSETLIKHLSNLKRQGIIKEWYDHQIGAGEEWEGEILEHLNSAEVILLLISTDFMASDYCYDVEVKHAMERHEAGEARVIPVILRPCDWNNAPFSKLQALPSDAKPITRWSDRDEAFFNVASGIRKVAENLQQKASSDSYKEKTSQAVTSTKAEQGQGTPEHLIPALKKNASVASTRFQDQSPDREVAHQPIPSETASADARVTSPKQKRPKREATAHEAEENNLPGAKPLESSLPRWFLPAGFILGAIALIAILVLVIFIPTPSDQQFIVFRILIALGGAAFSLSITGFITIHLNLPGKSYLVAGGSLAVFVVLFFFTPPVIPRSTAPGGTSSTTTMPRETPTPTIQTQSLSYSISVCKPADYPACRKAFIIPGEINFEKDYRIRINISAPRPGYLYIINEGPATERGLPQYVSLFPKASMSEGSAMLDANRIVTIPDESWLHFDEEEGTEKLWLVWSDHRLGEFEEAARTVSIKPQDKGALKDASQIIAIKDFLTRYSKTKPEIVKDNALKQSTVKSDGNIITHNINLEHH